MSSPEPTSRPIDYLLVVRKSLHPAPAPEDLAAPLLEAPDTSATCISCGYEQSGQVLDRCPECGLLWASRLCDSTPWGSEQSPRSWFDTARSVLLWDYRTRVRTGLVPATPVTHRFGTICVWIACPLLALSFALLNAGASGRPTLLHEFLLSLVAATLFIGVGLVGTRLALRVFMRGQWRRTLDFVPSSVDYACAWWLVLAGLLVVACLGRWNAVALTILIFGTAAWAFWLWGSSTESQHVLAVAPRIGAVILLDLVAALSVLPLAPGAAAAVASQTWRSLGLGPPKAAAPTQGPVTWGIIVDALPGDSTEPLVSSAMRKLGADQEHLLVLSGTKATLTAANKAFATVSDKIRPQDRVVIYLNGHGAENGAGSIQLAEGFLTALKLRSLLSWFSTPRRLVVIDSCFGGKFLEDLNGKVDAVVLASTDDGNVAFRGVLGFFWQALLASDSDLNGDGQVSVDEAFWRSYKRMLDEGEQQRQNALDKRAKLLLEQDGFQSPQLEEYGKGDARDFAIKLPPPPTPQAGTSQNK